MLGSYIPFFGITTTLLVRHGVDERLRERVVGTVLYPGNTLPVVYCEMLLQVCKEYPGLPDARTLKLSEIKFFYDGCRNELKKYSENKNG